MEPTNQITVEKSKDYQVEKKSIFSFEQQAKNFESARFGWMAILITIQSCLGSIACMYVLKNDASTFILVTCAAVTMGSNALFIALAPPKVCLIGFYLSVITNILFLLLNL